MKACSIPGCGKPFEARGLCNKHYHRLKRLGDPLIGEGNTERGDAQKFLRDVVLNHELDECLIWPFGRTRGYGRIGNSDYVHRLACEAANGPPPTPKHEASHSCGRGAEGCCAKRHLSWKTKTGNAQDRVIHGSDLRGEKHALSKLTSDIVRAIRASDKHRLELAALYGVNERTIRDIRGRRSWAWLT